MLRCADLISQLRKRSPSCPPLCLRMCWTLRAQSSLLILTRICPTPSRWTPQDPSCAVSKEEKEESTWGQPLPTQNPSEDRDDSFKIGKTSGNYLIKQSDIGQELFKLISSTRCEIIKNKEEFLKDYSRNGTFVNGNKVGQA